MASAEFVRDAALSLAGGISEKESATIPPGIIPLIQSTYRYAYILATLERNEMIRERRGDEVDKLVLAARESQALLFHQDS